MESGRSSPGFLCPTTPHSTRTETWFYFAESGSDRIRRVNLREGTLHNFAGIGETCYSGDEGPCGEAGLYLPLDVAFDSRNDLYICDSGSNRIRKVDHETGIITTIIGTGQHGFNGDGPALEVNLTWPAAIAFDSRRCDVHRRHPGAPNPPLRSPDRHGDDRGRNLDSRRRGP